MSLEDLLGEEPPATVVTQTQWGKLNASGMPLQSFEGARSVQGRAVPQSARQQLTYLTVKNVVCDYKFISRDACIGNGDYVQLADGRLFRVTGTGEKHYAKGSIPDHWDYPMQEVRVR